MRKDEAEVYAGAHGFVHSIGVQGKQPVGFERQAKGFAHGVFYAYIGYNSKEGLLV